MEAIVLIENVAQSQLKSEHGLSIYIRYGEKNIVLDAGQTGEIVENAKLLGVSLESVHVCVLSHGHYDHAGGFTEFFKENHDAKVFAMNTAFDSYYSNSGGDIHEIGVPKAVREYKERFVFIDKVTELMEGVYCIPHTTKGLEKIGERTGLFMKKSEKIIFDDFSHEMSLVFDTPNGLVLLNSCSHAGIVNIMEEVKKNFPNKNIYTFIGGLHMMRNRNGVESCIYTEQEVLEMAEYLQQENISYIYTGHCTGNVGFAMLKEHLGERLLPLCTGTRIKL